MFWLLLFLVAAVALAYASASFATTTAVSAIAILLFGVFGHAPLSCLLLAVAWAVLLLPLNADALRQEWFTRTLLSHFRERLRSAWPRRSGPLTEGAGSEARLMQPRMDWERLQALPTVALNEEEQAFVDGPVETFCRLCHAWRAAGADDELPPEIWTFLRRYGLLALRVPQEHGGMGFSSTAVAAVLTKIGSSPAGVGVAEIIAQANAHGLIDWLLQEGSDAQKLRWLAALARGEAIACAAPSDFWKLPASTDDDFATGIVVTEHRQGSEVAGIRLNLQLPAVALAPVADLIAVCFELHDPERRLGAETHVGATCALLPRDTVGLQIDRSRTPGLVLPAGIVRARDLFVPLEWILGGIPAIGKADRLTGASLGMGRPLPLAAAAAGNAVFIALASAAWARIQREQGHAISERDSVHQPLARIAAEAYGADALRRAAAAALDRGECSATAGLLLATQSAALNRSVTREAVSLLGNDAIRRAPLAWLQHRLMESAACDTGEGANRHSGTRRAFMEALYCGHPFLGGELRAAHDANLATSLEQFDALIWPHFARIAAAAARSWLLAITGSLGATVPSGTARRHRQRASRYSAALTLSGEVALLWHGDLLLEQEVLLGRLGEILGLLYRLHALLRKWEDDGQPADDWAIVDWACLDLFRQIEAAFADAQRRLPSRGLRYLLRVLSFPFGRWARPPSTALTTIAAARLWSPGSSRQRLAAPCFAPRTAGGPLNDLDAALNAWLAAERLARRCEEAQRQGRLPQGTVLQCLPAAIAGGLINDEEAEQLRAACSAVAAACGMPAPADAASPGD